MKANDDRDRGRSNQRELEKYPALAERLASGGRTYGAAILMGVGAGILFALGGIVLALLGISGAIEFVVDSTSFKAKLTNASPGVVIAAMGMIVLWRYKPKLTHDVEFSTRGLSSSDESHDPVDNSDATKYLRGSDAPTFRSRGRFRSTGNFRSSGSA